MYPYGNPNNNPNDYYYKNNPPGRIKYVYKDSPPQKEEWQFYANQPVTRTQEEWQSYGNPLLMPYYDRQQVPSDMMMYATPQQYDQYKTIPMITSLPKIPKFSGYEFHHDVSIDQQIELYKNQIFTLEQMVLQQQQVIMLQQKHQQQLIDKLNSVLPPEPEKFQGKNSESLRKIDENLMTRSIAIRKSVENLRKETQPKLDESLAAMNRLCNIFENLAKVKVENEQKSPIIKQDSPTKSPQAPPEDRKLKHNVVRSPSILNPPKPDPIKIIKKKPVPKLKENTERTKNKNRKVSREELNSKRRMKRGKGDKKTPKRDSLLSLKKKIKNQPKVKEMKPEPNPKGSKCKMTLNRIASDAPTALIAPDDYQHIYHTPIVKQTENLARIPSDTPTTLIAPDDYQHLYSFKDQHARFVEKFENEEKIEPPKQPKQQQKKKK